MKVAYLVSRFPHISETFIVRELDGVSETADMELTLLSLFPATDETVHPRAVPWVARLQHPALPQAVAAVLWWLVRRPLRFLAAVARVTVAHVRNPAIAIRALATIPLAAAHARTISQDRTDHVHAHFATYPALAAWLCNRLTGVSYSFTAHAHDIFVHRQFLQTKVSDASFVVAISRFNASYLREHAPSSTPIEIVHCGVDVDGYAFEPRRVSEANPIRILCVAGLRESKGHEVLLRALEIPFPSRNIHLSLVGDGPRRGALEGLVADLGLEAHVSFTGNLTEEEVGLAMREADLFVLPSVVARNGDMEGIPVALMEAMASGLPVIASDLSGIPELVRDGETGILAKPGDPVSLRRAIEAAIASDHPQRLEHAHALVVSEFDYRKSSERMAALFRAGKAAS